MRVTVECLLPVGVVVAGWQEEPDMSIKTQIDGFKPVCLSVNLGNEKDPAIKLACLYRNIVEAGAIADDTCGISLYDPSTNALLQRTPNNQLPCKGEAA